MAHNAYITLANSTASVSGRVRVMFENYGEAYEKSANVQRTITGKVDISMGGVLQVYRFMARCRHTESDANYLTIGQLRTLYLLNNPSGTPSNVITMTDHFNNAKSVYMLGTFDQQVLSIEIEGTEAWYIVELTLLVAT